jgi:hypothetical protein
MTDTQRDKGRVIAILILLSIMLFAMLSGCSPYYYQSKGPEVTHVLALTKEGDTLKIPIKDIKPNVIYNVVGYDWYRPYSGYYTRWDKPYYHPNFYNLHKPINNGNSNYNNNSSNNTPVNTTPTVKPAGSVTPPNPVIINPRKNN